MKTYLGSGGIAPRILDLCTSGKCTLNRRLFQIKVIIYDMYEGLSTSTYIFNNNLWTTVQKRCTPDKLGCRTPVQRHVFISCRRTGRKFVELPETEDGWWWMGMTGLFAFLFLCCGVCTAQYREQKKPLLRQVHMENSTILFIRPVLYSSVL